MSERRLSPLEREALGIARRAGELVHRRGGYWTFEGVRLVDGVPVWWIGSEMVRGLVARGLLRMDGRSKCRAVDE